MDLINNLEREIIELRTTLLAKEKELYQLKKTYLPTYHINGAQNNEYCQLINGRLRYHKLPKWAIERYSRQILLPDIGVEGQKKLCSAKVLIVGAGGLGCPSAAYLAGAGIGEIGIVDYDTVDLTNIHRQILHREIDQGMSKADSAADSCRNINSTIKITPYIMQLDSSNTLPLVSQYDIVLDCTDNVPARYLLGDACALAEVPLISGSALKMEGQLTIYGYRAESNPNEKDASYRGPCYRCVFPAPPPPAAVGSCSANGVAGPVPAAIGSLQALEAIKYIVGATHDKLLVGRMLIFDGEDMTFRTVKLRRPNPQCAVCSDNPTITKLIDYEEFCQAPATEKDLDLKILPPQHRITATELASKLDCDQRPLLVDVRSNDEFNAWRIDGAVSRPVNALTGDALDELLQEITKCAREVIFICRRGNDSQVAAKRVLDLLDTEHRNKISDVTGGLHAWAQHVDNNFPVY